jgi:hypothetical protein
MTAPEQPTPGATFLADELWWILGSRGGDARQGAIRDAAERIDRFAAQRAAEAGEQDREIAEIQEEHGAQWRLKHRWIIVDNGDGSFTVHEHSGDSVWPSTDYPNKRLAAARLLQLLGIGPVAPQAHPESVCIELPGEGTAADTTATPAPSPPPRRAHDLPEAHHLPRRQHRAGGLRERQGGVLDRRQHRARRLAIHRYCDRRAPLHPLAA